MNSNDVSQFYEWLKPVAQKDGTLFDLHGYIQQNATAGFEKRDLKTHSAQDQHINLRVLKDKKSGVSYTKDFSKTAVVDCYQKAKQSMDFTDSQIAGLLAENQIYPSNSLFYDLGFQKISLRDKVEKARDIYQSCVETDSKVQPVSSYISDTSLFSFMLNSHSLQCLFQTQNIFSGCYSLAVDKESRSNAYISKHSKHYSDLDFKKIGRDSAQLSLKKLNYNIPSTKKYPVIFQSGQPAGALIERLVGLMSGKAVFEGLSQLKGSLNKKLFSEELFLYDEPLALWGSKSCIFDGEGFSSVKTPLVSAGVLQNYLTDSFYAKELKVPHTKKAYWMDEKGLNISASNIVMSAGKSSYQDLLKEFPQVIVIDYLKGFAGYNPVSGDFSIESEGFLWEKGESRPICQFTVSGNIMELFANILKISSNIDEIYNGCVKAPSFLVSSLMIAGK